MDKQYDFKVVDMGDKEAFETEIKSLLADGYELHGGMTALKDGDGLRLIQAVIKEIRERRTAGFSIGR